MSSRWTSSIPSYVCELSLQECPGAMEADYLFDSQLLSVNKFGCHYIHRTCLHRVSC